MSVDGISQPGASVVSGAAAGFVEVFAAQQQAAIRLAYLLTGDAELADPPAYLRRAVVNQVRGRFRRAAVRRKHEPHLGGRLEHRRSRGLHRS